MLTLLNKNFEDFFNLDRTNMFGDFQLYKDKDLDEKYIEIDMPGVKKEDILLEMEDRRLFIKAERNGNRAAKYSETIIMPKTLDMESCRVSMDSGVLRVSFKEKEPEKTKRKLLEIT